jgi:hypothetical protein
MPTEYAMRPQFGTRYFSPVATFLACVMMFLLGGFAAFGTQMPFGGGRASDVSSNHGLVSLTMLAALFFLGNLVHGPRLFRRMLHPELELHSEYEGPALPFLTRIFERLPYGRKAWPVRIVYEPLTLFVVTAVLSLMGVFDRSATLYLLTAAVLLSVKCYLEWFRMWLYMRILLDGKAAAPVIAAVARGTATEEQMASVHIAGIPKSVSPQIKAAVIAQRTGILPPALASLVSPVERPDGPEPPPM